ncbi:peptidoglycan DD-metalloendopeptidase family protein [Altererythrobacter aestuarii]|uniref:Peptidoglycan DD-metalloendopeptidase family protein n=1 Tax=Alteraurantiacibacter aestuarii TaxID=650004 RepID=A0A844ZJI4_9SPHN|nr:peptidoglycan DD-metalloendopeptidase family protein [Alteraurantiacibacter aestuarii]
MTPQDGDFPPAQLLHDQILHEGRAAPRKQARIASFADRYHEWREHASLTLSGLDLAPDLARDIGSRRWLRGVATLVGLSAVALSGWPGFSPVEAAPAMQIDEDARDEFRSQMIMPLALGGDSGRRMGATLAVIPLANAPERPRIEMVATLTPGDGFDRMLRRAGVSEVEAERIAGMVGQAMPLEDIAPGTQVDITLGRRLADGQPRPLDALSFRARFDLQIAVERRNGELFLDPRPILVDTTPLRIRGDVGSSLYRSARAAGAPAKSVQQFLRVLSNELDLDREISSTDTFDLIVDYKRAATGEVEAGDVLYAAIYRNGEPRRRMMRWGREGRYYEASGVGEERQGLMAPVPGAITSRYGMRRHPILGIRRMHAGLDFRASHGTPIYAVTDGRVNFAGRNGSYGNYVKLDHAGNLATGYAHMSRIAVNRGQQVRRGQVIGYVGSTGLSTGPHLHYEMYRGGQKVDPASVRFVTRAQLEGRELEEFRAQLASLQRVEPGAALVDLAPDPDASEEPVREIDRLENRQKVR